MDGEATQNTCQSFAQGCCGCCLNMRWRPERIVRYLEGNTRAARRILPAKGRPTLLDLVRLHRKRRGLWDHLLVTVLVMPTFGFSALVWKRWLGSCCFAGIIDESTGRVGCLIHPARVGLPDMRRHAFPLVPILGCDRKLICPMLRRLTLDFSLDRIRASEAGFLSLKDKK